MSVLHLSTRDNMGGAARATYRLHEALLDAGTDSRMLVQRKVTDDDRVIGRSGRVGAAVDIGRRKLDQVPTWRYRDRDAELFSPAWVPERRARRIERIDSDVVNLHWIAGGYLRPETLAAVDAPLVWTLHDMWPFTGGCHYAKDCERYAEGCGACPHLGSDDRTDLSRAVWERKRDAWASLDMLAVAPSEWLARCAADSDLFRNRRIRVIPDPVDTTVWRPRNPTIGRSRYDIPADASVVLFGADYGTPRKGLHHLTTALRRAAREIDDLLAVVFGSGANPDTADEPFNLRHLGRVSDEGLREMYGAADVMAVPSRQEAFGQTASEATACGTPVVAFDATGLRDVVVHGETGYLAEPFDPDDLAAGIVRLLSDDEHLERLGRNARDRAVTRFDGTVVAEQYRDVYRSVQ